MKVGQDLLDLLMKANQKTAIFELEGLAIAVVIDLFEGLIKGRRFVVFTDNQSAQSSVIRCKSKSDSMDLIIRKICSTEERLGIIAWIERVPSQSNPSDELSREVHESYEGVKCTPSCRLARSLAKMFPGEVHMQSPSWARAARLNRAGNPRGQKRECPQKLKLKPLIFDTFSFALLKPLSCQAYKARKRRNSTC